MQSVMLCDSCVWIVSGVSL